MILAKRTTPEHLLLVFGRIYPLVRPAGGSASVTFQEPQNPIPEGFPVKERLVNNLISDTTGSRVRRLISRIPSGRLERVICQALLLTAR